MSLAAASLLIVLRMCVLHFISYDLPPKHVFMALSSIAIWNRNKLMSALASTFWFTNVSFLVHGKRRA
jgi:hypothetical protein